MSRIIYQNNSIKNSISLTTLFIMKIIYIGDNRIRGNFGCRATSTALSMMIGCNHEIVGRVTGKTTYVFPGIVFFKYLPKWGYKILGKIKCWDKIQPIMARICFKLSRITHKHEWFDFISYDLDRSIKNLKKCLPANSILNELDLSKYDFDAVVVNGEGSFIFCTPQWREPLVIMMAMHWALKLGKKVFFMNAMFSDKPNNPRNNITLQLANNILSKCEIVNVREEVSYQYAIENLKSVNPILLPDALFTWFDLINDEHIVKNGKYYIPHVSESDNAYFDYDFTKSYLLISGSSAELIQKDIVSTIKAYSHLIKKLKKLYTGKIFLIQVCEGDYFLNKVSELTNTPIISMETPILAAAKVLANAEVFISGRYHPAIMASIGGTPCVFMGSNSHKTWSLQKLLEYSEVEEYHPIPSTEEIDAIVKKTLYYVDNRNIRERIKNKCKRLASEAFKMRDLIK